ncbi:MAG: 30S ribosomal protein S6 [bacterium]
MEKQYEIMLILKKESSFAEKEVFVKEFSELLKPLEGKVGKEDFWGLRRFAYPIKKLEEGVYTVIEFKCVPDKIKEVDRKLKLEKGIIRYLITSLND